MRVRSDWRRFSVATLLLCLLAALAVSAPEYARRTSSQRQRTNRAVRLDDHDADHALAAVDLQADLKPGNPGDGPDFEACLPSGVLTRGTPPTTRAVTPPGRIASSVFLLACIPSRAPPSA